MEVVPVCQEPVSATVVLRVGTELVFCHGESDVSTKGNGGVLRGTNKRSNR